MEWRKLAIFLLILSLISLPAGAEIIEVCPNCGNYEFVKVRVNCKNAILTDGEGKIPLNGSLVVVAKNSTEFFKKFGYYPDIEAQKVDRRFMLSNKGEEILLLCNGSVEDRFVYGAKARGLTSYVDKGLIYFRKNGNWDFRYEDWTNFSVQSDEVRGRILVFPNDFRFDAEKSLVIASYTLTNGLNLKELSKKGVKLEMYLDASPVGGIPLEELELVKGLNADVHFLSSNSYKNFHYKFAVADGKRVYITTENWKTSNRGYLIEFESERISNFLLEILKHDKIYSSQPGKISKLKGFEESVGKASSADFDGRVEVFVLPDSNPIFDLISTSKNELLIEVPYMDLTWFGTEKLLELVEDACKNGSKVRILLDSRYAKERNEKLVNFLNNLGKEKGYDLEARLIAPKGFEALHGKLIYADGRCLITSANFNQYGFKLNREIGVLMDSNGACDFLKKQFYEDWKERFELGIPNGMPSFDLPLALISLLAALLLYSRNSR